VFGNNLGVSSADLGQIVILGTLVLAILILKRRHVTLYAFDPTHAYAIGLSPRLLGALLLGVLALTAVVALQVVGGILVVALLIIPGATAYLLSDRINRMLIIAPASSAVCSIVGIYASYYLDTASGGMVVLVQAAGLTLVCLFSPRYGTVRKRMTAARRQEATDEETARVLKSSARQPPRSALRLN